MAYTTGGFLEPGVVEGDLRTRYGEATMAAAINYVLEVAEQLGVTPNRNLGPYHLYYEGDGEDLNYPPPNNWREILAREAATRGWRTYDVPIAPDNY